MVDKAPNDDAKDEPVPDSGRNDPAIDPDGAPNAEPVNIQRPPEGTSNGDSSTAEGNSYSPDFEPERKPDEASRNTPRDADIDTDGG